MAANGFMGETQMQRKHRGKYDNPRPKSQMTLLKEFLRSELADGVKVRKKVLEEKAREKGLTLSYFADAKTSMGLVSEKDPTNPMYALWSLPSQEPTATVAVEATVDPQRTHHACEDEFSLTVEERQKYGIRDNEQVVWIRDPRYWKGKEPGDPVRMFERNNAGGRVINYNGEHVGNGIDVILAARPMEEVEKLRAREQEQAERDSRQQKKGMESTRDDDFDKSNAERLRARIHANSQAHANAGMIGTGSPSSGMNYEDYVKNRGLSKADIDAEEVRYSLRGRASREYSQEEYEQTIAANRRAGGGRGREAGSGKFVSIPANVRPRNLMAR